MSREAPRGNLPRSATTLIGRDQVLPDDRRAGPRPSAGDAERVGGVGKTRLALAVGAELADEFPDGVWLVELASVEDPDAVPDAIANALGVTPQGDTPLIDTVAETVAGRRLLLVIDNCEHLLDGGRGGSRAAHRALGHLRIVATSREPLRDRRRVDVPVSPLALDGGVTSDAVTLFVARAGGARPGFGIFDERTAAAVVEICETLDGMPLGIELAAARMAAMSAAEVRDRLGDRFRLLVGPEHGPDRQSTLRHAVAWSYDLLDEAERAVMRTASVFAGGFTCGHCAPSPTGTDDVEILRILDSLVRKSLVVAHHDAAPTRYSLFDTIRAFADEQLVDAGDRDAVRDSARRVLRDARRRAVGAVERARLARRGRLGAAPSWPTCGRHSGGASTR